MGRADDREVAAVERGDSGDAEALGSGHDRGIDGAEPQITVLVDESCNAKPVGGVHRLSNEAAQDELGEEAKLSIRVKALPDQVSRFGNGQQWDDQRARCCR